MMLKQTLILLPMLFACVVAPQGGGYQAPPPTSPAFSAPAGIVIPAGTRMMVRMHSSVNSKQHKAGHRFYMTLESDLVVDNQTVAPRGSVIYGVVSGAQSAGRVVGKSALTLQPTDIMIGSRMYPIQTTAVQAVGATGSGAKTVGRTARGAAIGGLANGSKGARAGAKIGLGASILSDDGQIQVQSGTLVEFNISAPTAL